MISESLYYFVMISIVYLSSVFAYQSLSQIASVAPSLRRTVPLDGRVDGYNGEGWAMGLLRDPFGPAATEPIIPNP